MNYIGLLIVAILIAMAGFQIFCFYTKPTEFKNDDED